MSRKRLFDIVFSSVTLVLIAPILFVIGLIVVVKLGRPVLFRQKRPGRHGRIFEMYKFRTMTNDCDEDGKLLPNAQRLTSFGKILRATSLDELPELLNVLRGDMSVVGPRPLLVEYLDRYSPEQARRHEIRPGITGWAQIHGRNAITWEEKFALDVWYVDNQSLRLDLRILLLTLLKVLRREGIDAEPSVTMEPFGGSRCCNQTQRGRE